MQELRIVTLGFRAGAIARNARRLFSLIFVARTLLYTHDARVWALSLVQGHFKTISVAPCQTLIVSIRNLFIAVCPRHPL
jgi:hypothetical protein